MTSYDSPWKEALYQHLRWLLMLLFPKLVEEIDWREDHHPLEQELRQLYPDAQTGVRYADALIRVRLLSGDERILHAEVQAQKQEDFEKRVHEYNYRGLDHFKSMPEPLIILADDDPDWRPTRYVIERRYGKQTFEFVPAKLLDWADKKDELRAMDDNPMGLFILAHLEAQRTQGDDQERAKAKLDLLVRLAARKLDGEEARQWNRYLAWFLDLPKELDLQVFAQAATLTKETPMFPGKPDYRTLISYPEQVGLEKGERKGAIKGRLEGLEALLEAKFQEAGLALMPELRKIEDADHLSVVLQAVRKAASLDDVRKLLPPPTDTPTS